MALSVSSLPQEFTARGRTAKALTGQQAPSLRVALSLLSQASQGGPVVLWEAQEGPVVLTLYVSQFLKKLTEPSRRLWMTVQPPGSCRWSHHTCMRRLVFSGFTR